MSAITSGYWSVSLSDPLKVLGPWPDCKPIAICQPGDQAMENAKLIAQAPMMAQEIKRLEAELKRLAGGQQKRGKK